MFRALLILFLFFSAKGIVFAETVDMTETAGTPIDGATVVQGKPDTKQPANSRLNLAEKNPVAALLCKAIRAFTGTIAKVIALLMIIGLAINLFAATTYNPVSPVTVISLVIGAGILFSADLVVGRIIGDAAKGSKESACDCKYGIDDESCNETI